MEVTKISTTEFNTIQDLFGSRHFYYVEDSQQKGETGYGYVDSEDTIKVIRSEDGYSPGDILDYYNEDFQKRLQHFRETFFPPEQCQNSDQCTDSTQYPYTHNDVFLDGNINYNIPNRLTPNNITEDIDYIIYILETAYVGACVLREEVDNAIYKLEELKSNAKEMPTKKFHRKVSKILSQIPDNHLGFYYLDEPFSQNKASETETNYDHAITPQNSWHAQKVTRETNGHNYVVGEITISRMNVEDDPAFAPAMREIVENSDALIINLQGNRGGSFYPISLLRLLSNQRFMFNRTYYLRSPEALAIRANQYEYCRQTQGSIEQEHIDERNSRYRDAIENDLPNWHNDENIFSGKSQTALNKPIIVLIDGNNFSSTEEAISILKRFPEVTLMGTHTGGAAHFGGCGRAFLPNSHLALYCGARYVENLPEFPGDITFIEKIGYAPDIYTKKTGEAAMRLAHTKIRQHFEQQE